MRLLAALALCLALALAACGGDDEAEPSPTASASPSTTVSITASPTPSPSPTPGTTLEQLAYIAADGGLWLVNSDGTGQRKITDQCGGTLWWAPSGDLIVCNYFTIAVFDIDGQQVWQTDDAAGAFSPRWSTDGSRIAYMAEDYSLHIADVYGDSNSVLEENALPLAWLGENKLLAGLALELGDFTMTYDAYVMDLSTGDREPLPYFDDGRRLWLAPNTLTAVVAEGGGGTTPIGIYDFATGEEHPLDGFTVGGVSEGIPDDFIAFSRDSESVYAAYGAGPTTIYRADVAGTGATELGTVPAGGQLAISGSGLVAWLAAGGIPETLTISDLEQGSHVEVGQGYGDMTWRPVP